MLEYLPDLACCEIIGIEPCSAFGRATYDQRTYAITTWSHSVTDQR